MMREIYKWGTLGLATMIGITVSLACSYWFFYSLMGGSGPEAIAAGIAGCALQLFGYGFAASFLRLHGVARLLLCAMPLALSMFSSYSAMYGYLSHEQATSVNDGRKTDLVYGILEQSSEDKSIAAAAASQGVADKYRTQARGFLEANERARAQDVDLLDRLDEQTVQDKASPLDGLVKVTGDQALTTVLFCAWLAVLFDLLPVIAIAVISANHPVRARPTPAPVQSMPIELDAAASQQDPLEAIAATPQTPAFIEEPLPEAALHSPIIEDAPVTAAPKKASSSRTVAGEGDFFSWVTQLQGGSFEPTYGAFQQHTGLSKWQAQNFFKQCLAQGIVAKEGRRIKVLPLQSKVAQLNGNRIAV